MMNARIMLLMGNQAFSTKGSQEPFSLTGSQSYLSSIQPLPSALAKKPFRALNWRAIPRTKNVGIAMIGASHLDLSSGLLDSRMVSRTIQNVPNARSPPMSGLATHDITTSCVFSQLIRDVSCWTSRTSPTPMIPPIML